MATKNKEDDKEDPRPFLYANLGDRDSILLLDTCASISDTDISLPLTNEPMTLHGLTGSSFFTQSQLIPLVI